MIQYSGSNKKKTVEIRQVLLKYYLPFIFVYIRSYALYALSDKICQKIIWMGWSATYFQDPLPPKII